MTDDRVNLKITRDVHAQHSERREELGLTWSEYLRRCEFSDGRTNENDGDRTGGVDTDALAASVAEQIDYAYLADAIAEQVTASLRERRP